MLVTFIFIKFPEQQPGNLLTIYIFTYGEGILILRFLEWWLCMLGPNVAPGHGNVLMLRCLENHKLLGTLQGELQKHSAREGTKERTV